MKIKSVILGLSSFILSTVGQSDCEQLRTFFIRQSYSINDCCGNSRNILCDDDDNIKSINLDALFMNNYNKPLSLRDFPKLENLVHLTFSNVNDAQTDPFNGIFPANLLDLPNLETLEITNIKISSISSVLNKNSNLKTLKLRNNEMTGFPYQFKSLPQLTNLDVSNNLISGNLSPDIKEFQNLKNLNLDNNQLTGELIIPDSLDHIYIRDNQFRKISKDCSLQNLEYIEAVNNMFDESIFSSLTESTKLKTLVLGYNKNINSIPDDIYLLNSLENLDLSGTSISVLPNNFYALSNLHYLNLANNEKLNLSIVNFGNQINVCDFTNTQLSCYQPDTCTFAFGSTNYRDCNDYEIEKLHKVDEKVSEFVKKKSKSILITLLVIVGLAFVILIVTSNVVYIIKRRSNRKHSRNLKHSNMDEENSFASVSLTVDDNDSTVTPTIRNTHSKVHQSSHSKSYHSSHNKSHHSSSQNKSHNSTHSKNRSSYYSKSRNSYHSKIHNSSLNKSQNKSQNRSQNRSQNDSQNDSFISHSHNPTTTVKGYGPVPLAYKNTPEYDTSSASPMPYNNAINYAPTVFSNIATVQSTVVTEDDDESSTNKNNELMQSYQIKNESSFAILNQSLNFSSPKNSSPGGLPSAFYSPSEITVDDKDTITTSN